MRPTPRPLRPLRPLRALLALVLLALAGWLLLRSGGPDGSRTVPLDSFPDFQRWADDTPTPVMATAVARLGGLVAVAYLGVAVVVALVANALRCKALTRVALAATPAAFRRLLGGSVARVGLIAGAALAPSLAATTSASAAPAQQHEQPTATMTRSHDDGRAVATMVRLGADSPAPSAPPHAPAPPQVADVAVTRVVRSGDSFWSIAEEATATNADADILGYWQALVTANRDRLVAPDCPDLLIPGQTLVLPAP